MGDHDRLEQVITFVESVITIAWNTHEASMAAFYDWLGPKKSRQIRLAVMDMWKPLRNVTKDKAPQAAILSANSTSCAISGRRSTRCARPNTAA